jgi:hypothetical protein
MNNNGQPIVISQARLIVAICDGHNLDELYFNNRYVVSELAYYLLSLQKADGLFLFNKTSWMRQDEGIASVWSGIALIRAYEYTKNPDFRVGAISAWDAMYKHLYSEEKSLLHTKKQTWWTLNVAVLYALLGTIILKYIDRNEIRVTVTQSLDLILSSIADDGHFPYNEKRPDVYILLYHSHVIYFLQQIALSRVITENESNRIDRVLMKAGEYLQNQMGDKNLFVETSREEYESYVITSVISLAALKNELSTDQIEKILFNITQHYSNGQHYLFKDSYNKLTNKDLGKYNDVLLTEILYWLIQFRL